MSRPNGHAQWEHNPKDIRFTFFPAKRRKVILEKMTANEKDNNPNLVFSFCMPLTGEPMLGLPEFIQPAYEAVNKEGSLVPDAGLGAFELSGMTIEFFRTEEHKKRMLGLPNKSLMSFSVEREKDGDTFKTVLRFKVRIEESKARLLFWHDQRGVAMWADFTPAADSLKEEDDNQMSFEEQASKAKGGEDEEDDGEGMPHQTKERSDAVSRA